ncbi:MAG: anti-sigma factor [Thalassolituus sp.]|jgi:anti-sigma-K factor RskA|uniref:Anti-sigma K factor RskA C-terminal domain-containing protein n=2 Tax=root TaxID=1 RepID=M5DW35_9GAMM|nr:anti-sigma factor [Thalassolituus oleivorans]PHQ86783.1 MAG: anti-sigma factor [Thalassobium sp.]AHK16907.1 hypothetical protein R615_15970 [Thalassolituus oleivorans R6-15]APR68470.1 hypothetical protein CN03_16900 [Thalassolituus oleivorans]MBQ0726116.1 anti-sigma factor [Thalassolituus oleivorans]MBQ0782230.1 anti-sigma factor [Thalassolituus oleivorans]|tara:strand:+ start:388 stop:1104 length:717 start_codon:yes stop_codon:yes gene_type:complete
MNYLTEERKDALAAEYVLGTLHGAARSRFQRLMREHAEIRERVYYWERTLAPMTERLLDAVPSPQLLRKIQLRLGHLPEAANDTEDAIEHAAEEAAANTNWGWLAALSTAAMLVLAVLLVMPGKQGAVPLAQQIAIIQNAQQQPLWLLELSDDVLHVQATAAVEQSADHDYELWIVAADGRAPISLGVVPESGVLDVPRHDAFDNLQIAALAISLEQPGGSVTGLPGQVLYTATLTTL